jgi:hypothetical protein
VLLAERRSPNTYECRPTDEQLDRADLRILAGARVGVLLCGRFERLAGLAVVM